MKIAQLPQRKRKQNIILLILILGLPLVLFAAYQVVQIVSRASADIDPKSVVISNLTTNMITVSWTTDSKTIGSIIPLENGKEKTEIKDARDRDKRNTHYVELTELEPNTEYSFKIKSDSKKYTSSEGKDLKFKTPPVSAQLPSVNPVSGEIPSASDDDILIYVLLSDNSTFPVSATLASSKTWYTDLSALLKVSDKSRVSVSDGTGLTVLATDGKGNGAILTGTYSSLFDSSGALKEANKIELVELTDIYAKIPNEAKLSTTSETPEPEPEPIPNPVPEPEPVPKPNPVPAPYVPDEPEEPQEPQEEEEFEDRQYRIVQQLQWGELVLGSSTSSNTGPSTVRITNLTDAGFTVLWISQNKEKGYVKYGTSPSELENTAHDQRDNQLSPTGTFYVHSVRLERLQKETKYYFEIVSGEDTYNNNENMYSATTLSIVDSAPASVSIVGEITNPPSHGEVVVIGSITDEDETGSLGTTYEVSTVADEGGSWTMSIADMRFPDSNEYFEYTDGDTLLLEPYTTIKSEKQEERVEGIDERDIQLEIVPTNPEDTLVQKVSQLSDYGITNDPSKVIKTSNGKTPETGIFDSFLGIMLIALALLLSGIGIAVFSKKKVGKSDKMSNNL